MESEGKLYATNFWGRDGCVRPALCPSHFLYHWGECTIKIFKMWLCPWGLAIHNWGFLTVFGLIKEQEDVKLIPQAHSNLSLLIISLLILYLSTALLSFLLSSCSHSCLGFRTVLSLLQYMYLLPQLFPLHLPLFAFLSSLSPFLCHEPTRGACGVLFS